MNEYTNVCISYPPNKKRWEDQQADVLYPYQIPRAENLDNFARKQTVHRHVTFPLFLLRIPIPPQGGQGAIHVNGIVKRWPKRGIYVPFVHSLIELRAQEHWDATKPPQLFGNVSLVLVRYLHPQATNKHHPHVVGPRRLLSREERVAVPMDHPFLRPLRRVFVLVYYNRQVKGNANNSVAAVQLQLFEVVPV